MNIFQEEISELKLMKKYPNELFYIGNTALLNRKKVSIIGSRKPNQYAREFTYNLANRLSQVGVCIVSGGAIGIDAIAHKAAGYDNTIMVAATGLDKRYPAVNRNIIQAIEENGLVLSQFKEGTPSQRYNFPIRNEVVVALGDILIVTYADNNSGTMRSIEYALKMNKEIYVLPHRLGESDATNKLLQNNKAKAIYNLEKFIAEFGEIEVCESNKDEFLRYCKKNPDYDAVVNRYASKVFEYELLGKIKIINGKIKVLT
jgi:DNA processing protein